MTKPKIPAYRATWQFDTECYNADWIDQLEAVAEAAYRYTVLEDDESFAEMLGKLKELYEDK